MPLSQELQQFKETVHRDRLKWAEVVKAVGATIRLGGAAFQIRRGVDQFEHVA